MSRNIKSLLCGKYSIEGISMSIRGILDYIRANRQVRYDREIIDGLSTTHDLLQYISENIPDWSTCDELSGTINFILRQYGSAGKVGRREACILAIILVNCINGDQPKKTAARVLDFSNM